MCGSSRRWGRRPARGKIFVQTPSSRDETLDTELSRSPSSRWRRRHHPDPRALAARRAPGAVSLCRFDGDPCCDGRAHGENMTDRGQLPDDELVVRVTGGAVRGVRESGLLAWRGIPYAAPPVGELRFAAPGDVVPWRGI